MVFSTVLDRFVDRSPFCVMARGLLENVFKPEKIDALFQRHSAVQRQRKLFFSTCVDVMASVVCRIHPSVHAAYLHFRKQDAVPAGVDCLYEKLQGVETQTSRALVQHTATEVDSILDELHAKPIEILPGYDVRIVDGNHPNGTEHRLEVLRDQGAAALPGLAVAVLDPQQRLIRDVLLSTDGHAQECTFVKDLLALVGPGQVWLADRHYCTSELIFGLAQRPAFFLIRQHSGHLRWRLLGDRRYCGRTATGEVYEQKVMLTDPQTGKEIEVRRITVVLDKPTRDKDTQIHLLSNLPEQDDEEGHKGVSALVLAELYCQRWLVETAFAELTVHLRCELNTLGYPEAALFGFCVAVCCYNLLAAMRGAVRVVHGEEEEQKVSGYYSSEEIKGTYRGMDIAVPEEEWEVFRKATPREMALLLEQIARKIKLSDYYKSYRGPKKPKEHKSAPRQHISTDRLLHPERYPAKKKKKKKASKQASTSEGGLSVPILIQ